MDGRAFYAKIERTIAESGRALISVPDAETVFTYSIGNSLAGVPELIVFGLSPGNGQWLLNAASAMPEAIASGMVDLGGTHPVKAVPCADWAKDAYSIQATRYLRHDGYPLVQLLVPDAGGRFPGDPACAEPYASVPALWRARRLH